MTVVKFRVLAHLMLILSTLLVSSTSAYGFTSVKKRNLPTSSTTPCHLFPTKKTDQPRTATSFYKKTSIGQVQHRTPVEFGKQPIFSMALASSSSAQEIGNTSAADLPTDALWSRMEKVANKIRGVSKTGGYFTAKQVNQQDREISNLLQTKANVSLQSPTTLTGVVKEYATRGGGSVIITSMLSAFLYRMSTIPSHPLGIWDILCVVGTRIFWEAHEWAIHFSWFHGGADFRAHPLFKSHDRHHDLPYYHVAVEPLALAISWSACVIMLLVSSVRFLGLSASLAATMFLTYSTSAFLYSFMHCICHSKIALKGRMKKAKECHIKHHMFPGHHFNMGPNNIDRLMKTDSYDTRLGKAAKVSSRG